ncbi:hypothetical protein [Streptomyces asoensis]|uniref:hypothetical protein n=1 Tax=Streptomyces asoensis TaxID=249586 RepID=UPI0033C707BE
MLTPTANEDSRLSFWLRVREFAVPASMIETATARRRAGDWAGACAAAGIDVDLDLRTVAREHGRDLTSRLRADLRHLAPDLLRWHMPRVAPDGLLRPGVTVSLARYAAGAAGRDDTRWPVHLVVRTPPAWADAGQRFSLGLWDGSHDTRAHPHPRPSRRFRLDLHRHLWDARRADELRVRAGNGGGTLPGPGPTVPVGHGCAVDRWADEAAILLRAEARTRDGPAHGPATGAVLVRLGGRQRLVLGVGPGPAVDLGVGFGPAVGPGIGLAPGATGFGPAVGLGTGVGLDPRFGPAVGLDPEAGFGRAAGFGPGTGPGSGPGLGPGSGPGLGLGTGPGFGPAAGFDLGTGSGFGAVGPGAGVVESGPRILTASAGGGRGTSLPVLPDAATWVPPDLELIRAGAISADRLHPLVASALTSGRVPPPTDRDRSPGPAPAPARGGTRPHVVDCRGEPHRIGLVDGVLAPLDHGPEELRREELLAALTGTPLPCLQAVDDAHRRPDCLTGVRERLVHGDVDGALDVVEGLLGPAAVLRDGPLRDALETAARRRIAYGLFRAGLSGPSPDRYRPGPTRPAHHRSHPRHTTSR